MSPSDETTAHSGILLIKNADAGGAEDLEVALEALPDAEVCATSTREDLDAVLSRVDGRRVVVAGGDGSLHAVVAALHRRGELSSTELALVPLGTGNDFARGAGIPLEVTEAARLARNGSAEPLDLLVDDEGGVVVNAVHVGAGAEASRRAVPWKRLGKVGYAIGAIVAGVNPPAPKLTVTVDGRVVSRDRHTLQVAIGNTPYVGGGTELTPEADPGDGQVDVMLSYALGLVARLGYLVGLRRGRHHLRDDVRYGRAVKVTIAGRPFYASADGEIQGPLTRRTWEVRPGELRMVVPG